MEPIDTSKDSSGVFFVSVKDKKALFAAYMPFITDGALFVSTEKSYMLGDEVFLLVKLLDDPEKYPIAGRVVWITPNCAQGGRAAGIGVQFVGTEGQEVRNKIETHLAGMQAAEYESDTL